MKKLLLLLFLATPLFAGQKYGFTDPKIDDEFSNNYKEHKYPNWVNARGSSATITNLFVSNLRGTSTFMTLEGAQTVTGVKTWNAVMNFNNLTAARPLRINAGKDLTSDGPTVPTIQKFTSGTGTYTTPAGVQYIRVLMVGGGGGGGGSGSNGGSIPSGSAGGNSTFGTTLLVANGGAGGPGGGDSLGGGAGGTASLGTGPIGTALSGGNGGASPSNAPITAGGSCGGDGGVNPLGGSSPGAIAATAQVPVANTGAGGAGAGGGTTSYGGLGGGAGGYVNAIIGSPSATYSYAVGAAGAAGSAGTSGNAGTAGAVGYIEVTEYYF